MRSLTLLIIVVACGTILVPRLAQLWLGPFATLFIGHWDARVAALDFNVFYAAGYLVAHGQAHSIYTPAALSVQEHAHNLGVMSPDPLPYLNPPIFALVVAPITLLPFADAYRLWTAANLILLALTCWMTWTMTGGCLAHGARP